MVWCWSFAAGVFCTIFLFLIVVGVHTEFYEYRSRSLRNLFGWVGVGLTMGFAGFVVSVAVCGLLHIIVTRLWG